jgi:hypothetical protein
LPWLSRGRVGIEELMERANRLGIVMSKAEAEGALRLNQTLKETWAIITRLAGIIGSAFVPQITMITDIIAKYSKRVMDWVSGNKVLIEQIWVAATIIGTLGVALLVLGKTLVLLGPIVGALGMTFSVLGAIVSTAVGLFGGLIGMLASPLGLAVAASTAFIVAGEIATLHYTGVLQGMAAAAAPSFNSLGAMFVSLKDTAITAWGGIVDAFATGNLLLAGRIALAGLKLAWHDFGTWFVGLWNNMSMYFGNFYAGVMINFANFKNGLLQGWFTIRNKILGTLIDIRTGFAHAMVDMAAMAARASGGQFDAATAHASIEKRRNKSLNALQDGPSAADQAMTAEIDDIVMGRITAMKKRLQAETLGRQERGELQTELDRLVDVAAKKRAKQRNSLTPLPDISSLPDPVEIQRRIETHGTFNASVASGLGAGGGGDLNRTARATEQTVVNTAAIIEALKSGAFRAPVFG